MRLREEVESLFREHDAEDGVFGDEEMAGGLRIDAGDLASLELPARAPAFGELRGEIASYRILRKLGEGGMGTVYEAEQERPQRRVALKVIRPGLASANVLRRFELEWQLLGRLDHPGIAQIHEAGTAETNLGVVPFFAMELVEGGSLLEYAETNGLDLHSRLELVARICEAVEHAHRRGVIHRDLKPENILVNAVGQPKVLDSGVARAVDADMRASLPTSAGELVGTVTYMSPEQASGVGEDVDTRSDVYALGVVAYELVTGRLPYQLDTKSIPAAVRSICEDEPAPATRFEPHCGGDVDAMFLMALAKDPDRRYQSPIALAEDLRRFLRHEPILARHPTTVYRLAKLARRHAALVAAVVTTIVALVCGTVISTWMAFEAAEQRRSAVESSEDATRYARQAEQQAEEARQERDRAIRESARSSLAVAGANLAPVAGRHLTAWRHLESVAPELRDWEWRYLRSQVRVLVGHRSMVRELGFRPGGDRLLTVARDGAFLWDVDSLESVARFGRGKANAVAHFDFSPDGALLCLAAPREPLGLRDASTGEIRKSLGDAPSEASCVAFSPDGRLLAVGTKRGAISVWDLDRSAVLHELAGHGDGVHRVAFDGSGRRLASGSRDGTARIRDVHDGVPIGGPLEGHRGGVHRVALARDGTRAASCALDGTTRLWDVETGEALAVIANLPGRSALPAFAFSPDGERLAASSGLKIALLDARSGERTADLVGHRTSVLAVEYSRDGKRVYSSSYEGDIRAWDGVTGEVVDRVGRDSAWVMALAVSADGKRLAATGNDNAVRIFETMPRDDDVVRGHIGLRE